MSIVDIIYKEYSEEELDSNERKQLNHWLEEDPKNKKIYTQIRLGLLYPDDHQMEEIESEVWGELKTKLNPLENSKVISPIFPTVYKIAAILILGLAVAFSIYKVSDVKEPDTRLVEVKMIEKVSIAGQKITTTLPDGTKVKMNSDSKLIVPEEFQTDRRIVELSGEAFFEVVENKDWPFIVKSDNMEVKVLGTSFNVKAYKEDQVSKVAVKTGKVEVSGLLDEGYKVTLLPNDISSWDPVEKTLDKEIIQGEDAVFGWTEQKLVFENQSLLEVLNTLSKWYGVSFIDSRNIGGKSARKYTAKYKNPTLEQMMISLAHVYDFNFEIDEIENRITLE